MSAVVFMEGVYFLSEFFISLLINKIPGTTMMARPINTPMDSGKLLPKLGYLKSDTTPRMINKNPNTVFIFLNFSGYELILVI